MIASVASSSILSDIKLQQLLDQESTKIDLALLFDAAPKRSPEAKFLKERYIMQTPQLNQKFFQY